MRHRLICLFLCAALVCAAVSAQAVTLPSSLTEIEDEAFCGTPMSYVIIPYGVRTIGARAFANAGLSFAVIPLTVTSIGTNAFAGESPNFRVQVVQYSYAYYWCLSNRVSYTTSAIAIPTATPTPTATPQPTATPGPTTTPKPTATPQPTATPRPTSTGVSAALVAEQGDKYLYVSYSTMDCQAFVERCMYDAGLSANLAGSNAWFRAMTWTGTPEECKAVFGTIPVGAFLYILEFDGGERARGYYDGIGNASHMGLYIGRNGGAIHSSYSKGGVYYSYFAGATIPNGGWNRVGLWKRLDYGPTVNAILSQY